MGRRPGLLLVALSLLSLAGLQRWEAVEESLATAWLPLLELADALSPSDARAPFGEASVAAASRDDAGAPGLADTNDTASATRAALPGADALPTPATVAAVSAAWRAALTARPPVSTERELAVLPVLAVDRARRELVIAVPPDAVRLDAPVTHHGRYVGSLCAWRAGDRVVERGGRARVALPGHTRARPVAGEWSASEGGLPLYFLVQSRDGDAAITDPSRRLVAAQGQPVYTRDVSALGDDLPAGLLLGELRVAPDDRPGGGFDLQESDRANLAPGFDAAHLGSVVVEVTRGARLPVARREARRLGAPRHDGAQLRLDLGELDGLARGNWVVSGAQVLGVVDALGPLSSRVERAAPDGMLYVEDGTRLVPVARTLTAWPADWRPRPGQRVWVGHRELGALVFGVVGAVHEHGLELTPLPLPLARDVQVVQP